MKPIKFTPGQTLVYKPVNHRGQEQPVRDVVIVKVGTKYLMVQDGKHLPFQVERRNLRATYQGFGRGECYLDLDDLKTRLERQRAYDQLRGALPYNMPVGVSIDDIKAARKALGL